MTRIHVEDHDAPIRVTLVDMPFKARHITIEQ